MANKWLVHVKKTMKQMKSSGQYKKGDGLKKVIMAAKKTYSKGGASARNVFEPSKVRKGGEDSESDEEMPAAPAAAAPAEGARRRRSRKGGKTRRHSRK